MAFGRLDRSQGARGAGPMSDINMTPLIDVMLVLLVIFIVTAPLLASRLKLDLPEAAAAAGGAAGAVLAVSIDAQGRVFLRCRPTRHASASRPQRRRRWRVTRPPSCSCAPTARCPTAAWPS
jgi:biopolymer transport protein TolR